MSKGTTNPSSKLALWQAIAITAAFLVTGSVAVALPDAGSVIGNQATATYTDSTGEARSATSNLVETIVDQVAGAGLTATQSKTVSPAGTVYFPHTVTNTGNGPDSYTLSAAEDNVNGTEFFNFTAAPVIYADDDGDGIPDNFTPITLTPEIAAGESFNFVVAATVPGTVDSADSETIDVLATSVFDTGVSSPGNIDTVTITDNAVVDVTKAIDIPSGPGDFGPVTITLTYTNTGNTAATGVTLEDPLPEGMSYLSDADPSDGDDGSLWSGLLGTPLTPAADGFEDTGSTIDFSVTDNVVTAVIASVAPGESGTLQFQVSIDAGLPPGVLTNVANFEYDPDGSGGPLDPTTPVNTNPATYTVIVGADVDATDAGSQTDEAIPPATEPAEDDVVTQTTPATQGETISFHDVIVNNGDGTDTFEITLANDDFPPGTTFQLFSADPDTGEPLAPLTDTNGDGNPDTGPVDPDGGTFSVAVVATLPPGANDDNADPDEDGYSAELTATSTLDPAVSDTVTNTLASIAPSSVDLSNDSTQEEPDAGVGPSSVEDDSQLTVEADPGETVTIPLDITNTSGLSDSYDILANLDSDFSDPLPAGWVIEIVDPVTGDPVTNTGPIDDGTTLSLEARVTVPAGTPPGSVDVFFQVTSPTTGAQDQLHDDISVQTVNELDLSPDNTGQVFPGGSIDYQHTLTNLGNVSENSGTIAIANSQPGWTSVVYFDANGDGVLDPTDPVVTDLSELGTDNPPALADGSFDAGDSVDLFVKVFAPAGADPGDADETTLTVSSAAPDVTATNNTVVITGDVELIKEQGLDINCDGDLLDAGEIDYTTFPISAGDGAQPATCVLYRVTATNTGPDTITDLEINDTTPTFTTLTLCQASACAPAVTPGSVPALTEGFTGLITATVGNLDSLDSAVLTFGVKIDGECGATPLPPCPSVSQ